MSFRVDDQHLHQIFFSGTPSALSDEICPEPSEIWSAITDKALSRGKRIQVLDHCSRCRGCIQDLKIARTAVEGWQLENRSMLELARYHGPEPTTQASWLWFKRARNNWTRFINAQFQNFFSLPAFAVVTCLIAIVALKSRSVDREKGHAPAFRSEPSTLETSPNPDHRYHCTHAGSSASFSWVQDQRAASYELQIFGDQFNLLCSVPGIISENTTISIDECPALAKKGSFYWNIRSNHDDGSWTDSEYQIYQGPRINNPAKK